MLRRCIFIITLGLLAACLPTAQPPTPTATFAPRIEAKLSYESGQCVKVMRPTYLRFGPGLDYPVMTNIPARVQPPMHIFDAPVSGATCANPTQCSLRDEGWWWPVEVHWLDTGDMDKGWLWQGDFKAC